MVKYCLYQIKLAQSDSTTLEFLDNQPVQEHNIFKILSAIAKKLLNGALIYALKALKISSKNSMSCKIEKENSVLQAHIFY
jgi:hypothetical protein